MAMQQRSFIAENYRFGYQDSEKETFVKGAYTTEFRLLDVWLDRWFTPDVLNMINNDISDAEDANNKSNNKEPEKVEYKKPKSKLSGKEGAKDVPSWAKGEKPYTNENGHKFAERVMDNKYGKGNYSKKSQTEYDKIRKWGDRAFE